MIIGPADWKEITEFFNSLLNQIVGLIAFVLGLLKVIK